MKINDYYELRKYIREIEHNYLSEFNSIIMDAYAEICMTSSINADDIIGGIKFNISSNPYELEIITKTNDINMNIILSIKSIIILYISNFINLHINSIPDKFKEITIEDCEHMIDLYTLNNYIHIIF